MELKDILKKHELTEEQIGAITADMKENKIFTTNEENIDVRYSKTKGQKESLETELQEANDLINDLKASTKTSEELQTKISDYESQIETLQNQSKELQKQSAVDIALIKQGARNTKAVNALLDFDKVEVSEEGVKGLDEQLEALKESDAYLFQSSEDNDSPRIINEEGHQGNDDDDIDPFEEVVSKY